jgi:hypothetical protein
VATAFAALLAVFLHAFVVQAHVHAYSAPSEVQAAAGESLTDRAPEIAATHQDRACLVCETLAASGASVLADAKAPSAPPAAFAEKASLAIPLAPHAQTHSWRSRAPPIAL